jgi:regulator of RNase E activity RraA
MNGAAVSYVSETVLAMLEQYSSPTIANAIETFDIRPRSEGFLDATIQQYAGGGAPWTAFAVTAKMRSATPATESVPFGRYLRVIESSPGPRVVVVEDLDETPRGSMWGEVMANAHAALRCVGTITTGGVRDIPEVDSLGFRMYARSVLVSHAYAHVVEVGEPVTVGGMTVRTGDLLHGDRHGVVVIPPEIAGDLCAAAGRIQAQEREIIAYARSGPLDVEGYVEFLARYR